MSKSKQEKTESLMREKQLELLVYDLSRNGLLWENELDFFLRKVCQNLSEALQVDRIGVFLFKNQGETLRQINQYSATSNAHSCGLNLKRSNYPNYFATLNKTPKLVCENSLLDTRTRELTDSYLRPLKIAAKIDVVLYKTGKVSGILSVENTHESRSWTKAEQDFLNTISQLLAQRLLYEDIKQHNDIPSGTLDFNSALSNSSILNMISIEENGIIRNANQSSLNLLGFSKEEIIGQNLVKLIVSSNDDIEDTLTPLTEKSKQLKHIDINTIKELAEKSKNSSSGHEYLIKTSKGEAIPVALSINSFVNRSGQQSGYVCTAIDISKQIGTRRALREEEKRYKQVFEGTADGILLVNKQCIIDCNNATLRMYRCQRHDLINQKTSILAPELQANGQTTDDWGREKIITALNGIPQTFEALSKRLDGSIFDSEVTLTKVESDGKPYLLATVRDISKRKVSERELEKSRQLIIERNDSLALVNYLSNQLHASDSIDEIFRKTVHTLSKTIHAPLITAFTIRKKPRELVFKMDSGNDVNIPEISAKSIPISNDYNGVALQTGKPFYVPNIATDQRIMPLLKKVMGKHGLKSLVSIPLIYQQQELGLITLSYKIGYPLSLENIEAFFAISKTVSLALSNTDTRSKLDHIAHHDSLTGLSNRAFFHKQFKQRVLKGGYEHATLYLLDLDRFKEINDTLGHFTGDKVLQKIGPRLNALFANYDFVISRLGGDEFTILVYGLNVKDEIQSLAKQIMDSLRQPFQIDDLNLEIDTSVGIAIYPNDGMDSHALLRSADVAMYSAKKIGGGYRFYDQDSDIHTPERLAMIAEMGSSISSGQLFLHYQPKINIISKEIIGFEALARWDHPRLGLLGPSMFIPLIEMSNAIDQLTEEVLHQALAQQMQWRKQGMNYTVAVNISARNLIDDSLIKLLEKMLKHYDTPPGMLELEITETALMHDAYRATDYLNQIANLGILLSIDDFGTGYSSLSYLQKLPIHKLKLDREFIMGMLNNYQGSKIVETIILLANTLDLEVVAEGVEDIQTLNKLRELNCDQAQGYYICRPNTWTNIEHWLNRGNV